MSSVHGYFSIGILLALATAARAAVHALEPRGQLVSHIHGVCLRLRLAAPAQAPALLPQLKLQLQLRLPCKPISASNCPLTASGSDSGRIASMSHPTPSARASNGTTSLAPLLATAVVQPSRVKMRAAPDSARSS